MKHAEYCHQLALNSLGASLVDPLDLDLGLNNKGWGTLFSSRTFEEAVEIHKDMECSHSNGGMGQGQQSRTHSSGGMERHQLRTHSDGGMGQGHQLRTHSNGGTRQHHWSRAHSDSGMRQSGTQNFDRVLSDLEGLFTASSPLDQLQFLTSAFRKSVSILSTIKLQPLLQHCPLEQGN